MLTADREDVRKGESVELIVTFVNTKRQFIGPSKR